ncbi:MAG: serine hydrolase domain-containing protein [Chitinophagaceae bacterium]
MKKLIPFLIVLLLSCKGKNNNSTASKTLDTYFTAQQNLFHFNGNVLVAEKGEIIFQKSYGFADYKKERLLNDSSVFELASVSKQFTATAILLLKDRGKLKLTDSLRYYFPELPYYNITLQQMLTHVSGLPDYESAMTGKWNPDKVAFNADMIAFLANEKPPVYFAPGAKWLYSNTAYAILATIVEKVSGQTFAAFLAKNIFEPLGMTHSRVYNTRTIYK